MRIADARELPYADDSFAVVLMLTLLSSMPDATAVAAALSEAHRVLAPAGILIVYEPRLPNPFNRATRRIGRAELESALGSALEQRPITLLPPLARVLGPLAPALYPRLAHIRALTSHRLAWSRGAGTTGSPSP